MARIVKRILLCGWLCLSAVGCTAPQATLDLITVARKGLTDAQEAQARQHAAFLGRVQTQMGSLDVAFDADVKLIAAGGIQDEAGQPLSLTPEWVISARKGYAVARDALADEMRAASAAHAVHQDNLWAADEALEMASQLIVQQWAVSDRIRQALINMQRKIVHGQ